MNWHISSAFSDFYLTSNDHRKNEIKIEVGLFHPWLRKDYKKILFLGKQLLQYDRKKEVVVQ